MNTKIIKPRGTKNYYGIELQQRQFIAKKLINLAQNYSFQQIETPTFENIHVFNKGLGLESDIVQKEFFFLKQHNTEEQLVLRPEMTAPIVRCVINEKVYMQRLPLRFFYYGNMFRYERPQHGRYRQFQQFGLEIIGGDDLNEEITIILFCIAVLKEFNLTNKIQLNINYLGDQKVKNIWNDKLSKYFYNFKDQLSELSQNRIDKNPIRILDDKIDGKLSFVKNAPKIKDFLNEKDLHNIDQLKKTLSELNISYTWDETLVRGFDYYNRTIFEFVDITNLNKPLTIIGGGCYDQLFIDFGHEVMQAVGMSIGFDRFYNMIEENNYSFPQEKETIYCAQLLPQVQTPLVNLLQILRHNNLKIDWSNKWTNLNKHFKQATKLKHKWIMIYGQQEADNKSILIKKGDQQQQFLLSEIQQIINFFLTK